MDQSNDDSAERVFLHDLCNSLAVAQGSLLLLINKLAKSHDPQLSREEIQGKLMKTLDAIEKMNKLTAARRTVLMTES